MAGTQPTAPEPSGDGPKKKKRKGAGAFRRSPLKGYNPAPAWYGWGSAQLDGSPVFLWPDVPRMLRDPQIRFVERMWRAPFQKVKWSVSAPNKAVAQFVGAMLRRFWVRSLPKILSRYFRYGFAPGAAEFAPIRGRVRLVKVRAVEPLDAQARVWNDDHERAGELAGFDVAPHGALAPNQFKGNLTICSPHLFWFAGHGDLTQFHDAPPLSGCFEPWLEKRGRGGAIQSRKLWFRKAAWRNAVLRHPPGKSNIGTEENPSNVDNQDLARQMLDMMEAGGSMVLENTRHPADPSIPEWDYQPPESYSDVAGLREYPQDLDREILVGAGIPPEVLEASEVGSGWSGRMVPLMGYLGTIDELAGLLLEACDSWLGPLVALNFGENAWYEVKPLSLVDELQQQQQQGAMPGGGQPGLNPSSLFDGKPPAGGPMGGGGGDGPPQPGPGGAGGPLSLSVTIPEDLIRKAERAAGGHKYACAHVDVPRELAAQLKTLAYSIPNADLYDPANGKGRELESHVTVRFGLLTDEAADLAPIAADAPPARVTFTGIGHFDGAADGKPYDVVFAAVDSADLRRLNRELAALPHHDTHPEYVPHATIAYVRAGMGAQWARRLTLMAANLTGRDFIAPALVLSARDGSTAEVPFGASAGVRELSWGARGPLELGWTPYKGPKGGTGWVSDTGEVRYQESKPADDEGNPEAGAESVFAHPDFAHFPEGGDDHAATRAEFHKRAIEEGFAPADLHRAAARAVADRADAQKYFSGPIPARGALVRGAYETTLGTMKRARADTEAEIAATSEFAENYFAEDDPKKRALAFADELRDGSLNAKYLPEDTRAAVAEDLAHLPPNKLATLAAEAAGTYFERANIDPFRAAVELAAQGKRGKPVPFDATKPGDYVLFHEDNIDGDLMEMARTLARTIAPAADAKFAGDSALIVKKGTPLHKALEGRDEEELTDESALQKLFAGAKSEPMLAQGDVPASARDYGGTSGSKGTGEFRPEEGWNPNAVATYKRLSDDVFVKQRAAGDADSEPFELVHRKDVPDLTRLPAPYWEGLRDDGDTDADLEEVAQRRADKTSETGATRKRDIAEWKDQIRAHQKTIRGHRDAWNRALAGVPEDERPAEPDWDGPDASALTDQYDSREDHESALSDLSYALEDHAYDLAAEVEAARAHAEEYRGNKAKESAARAAATEAIESIRAEYQQLGAPEEDWPEVPDWDDPYYDTETEVAEARENLQKYREEQGKHAEARAKHVAAWNDADAQMKGHLNRYREARARHAEPDLKLNDELAKATETWRESIPDTAADEDAEAALQAVHEALDDIDNGDYPDHTEEPIAAEDYLENPEAQLPDGEDGTAEELADLTQAAAEIRAMDADQVAHEVDAHVESLPEASRKWRASTRADLDAARERVREALDLPEDVLTAEDGRAALEALAKQLDAFGKRLAGEGPRELSATVGPDGGDPNAMIAGQTNRLMRQRKAQLARALAAAMVRVQLGAAESGDPASAGPKLEQLAALAGGGSQQQQQPAPQQQQQAAPGDMGEGVTLGPLELSWEPYIGKRGARAGQQVGWIDTETKQVRYQKSKPGEHAEKRQTRQASESRGREILSRIAGRGATAAEIGELVDHLPVMSTRELRRARIMLDAKFGKSRTQRDMVNALLERVGGLTATDGTRADGTREADAAPTKPAGPPQPGEVRTVPTESLKVDPGRFQFKLNTNKEGVTKELQGVTTFNPEFAGTILAWRDPADGKDYVVNGHHRHELAKRTGHPEMAVRWIAAKDAREARAKGALVNIAEGRGTAVDAAKFMRDAGVSPDELARHGVSLKGKLAADAATLTKLNDKAFDRLARGGLDLERALAVSKHLSDPVRQERLFDLLAKREEAGKDLSGRTVEELARQMAAAPKVSKTESTLWGDETTDEDTFVERAELAGYVRAQLAQEANDFGAVASQRRADRVAGAGNTLNTEENARRQEAAEEVRAHYDGRAHLKGGVADALDAGAVKLKTAKTKKERERVRSETLEAVRNAVRGELDGLRKPDDGRGESGVDQVGGAASTGERAEAGAEDGARPAAEPAGVAVPSRASATSPALPNAAGATGGASWMPGAQTARKPARAAMTGSGAGEWVPIPKTGAAHEGESDTFRLGDGRFGKTQEDEASAAREEVATRAAREMGIPGPSVSVSRTPDGRPATVSDWVDGTPASTDDRFGQAIQSMSPDDVAKHALHAYLTADNDRFNARNFMLDSSGRVVSIDHGAAFDPDGGRGHAAGATALKYNLPFQTAHPNGGEKEKVSRGAIASAIAAGEKMSAELDARGLSEDAEDVRERVGVLRRVAANPGATYGDILTATPQPASKGQPKPDTGTAPQADPFAGATADHGPGLAGIPRNNSAYVAGHLVRRMADGRYQIEGGRGFVTGTAEEIADRIRDSWRRQSGERAVALKALDRAAAHSDADPFSDPQAADAEAAARENVPDGARAVSLDEATRGRVGVVRRDPETGIARLVFDRGEEGRATDFEPLDARHSWRKPGGQTAPGAKAGPKTGDLFGDAEDEPQAPAPHPWELRERTPENDAAAQTEYAAALRKQEKIEEEGKAAVRGLSNATRTQIGLGRAQEAYEAYQERHRENQKLLQALRSYSGKLAPTQPAPTGTPTAPAQQSPKGKPHEMHPDEYRKFVGRKFVEMVNRGESGFKPGSVKLDDEGELVAYYGKRDGWRRPASFENVWRQVAHDLGVPTPENQRIKWLFETEDGKKEYARQESEREANERAEDERHDQRIALEERATTEPHSLTKEQYAGVTLPLPAAIKNARGYIDFTKGEAKKYLDAHDNNEDVEHVVMYDYDHNSRKTGRFNIHAKPTHKKLVKDALAAGKPVPAEVLADYPDLAAKYAKPSAAPDYSKFDALLRTSSDRAQAEQIARATGVPIRPEAAAALPTKGNYAEWLRGTDPAALKAAAGSPAVDRAELLDAVKQVYGDAVHAEAKKKSKQGIADLLAGKSPLPKPGG